MMKEYLIFFLLFNFFTLNTDAAACMDGWTSYKDERCIKQFPNFLSYEDAKDLCASQGTNVSKSSLLQIKESNFQGFIESFSREIFYFVWLGGKFNYDANQFQWEDGEPLEYTNWLEGHPRNDSVIETCIQLRPTHVRNSVTSVGKWVNVDCQKQNLVICQMPSSYTLPGAIEELNKIRIQHEQDINVLKEIIEVYQKNILSLQHQVAVLSSNLEVLSQNAITNVRFSGVEATVIYRRPGYVDTSGYVITGVINHNSDDYVDDLTRRKVEKFVNGSWVTVDFT